MKTLCVTLASALALELCAGTGCVSTAKVVTAHGVFNARDVSDAALVRSLPGLENG